jgi:pimeloyl-ACP methyl ester carboxylesterase
MYYVDQGAGPPLLLLHGGTATVATSFGEQIPILAHRRRVIAPEQVGHGHTGDANRSYSYPQMADDTAALLSQLGVAQTDVLGISDGGVVGFYLAARHPALVRRLVVLGAAFADRDLAKTRRWADGVTPQSWPADDSYSKNTPDGPAHWPVFQRKILEMYKAWTGLRPEEITAIRVPTLVVTGDRDYYVSPERAAEVRRALPNGQLCVLPDTTHAQLHLRGPWLNPMIDAFLDQPARPATSPSK